MKGHLVLAKHGRCTSSQGALLLYTMKKLFEKLATPSSNRPPQIDQHIRQCIFCLYGHPNKKVCVSAVCI